MINSKFIIKPVETGIDNGMRDGLKKNGTQTNVTCIGRARQTQKDRLRDNTREQ